MNISLNPFEFLDGGCDVKVESYQGISSQILGKWEHRSGVVFQGPCQSAILSNSIWSTTQCQNKMDCFKQVCYQIYGWLHYGFGVSNWGWKVGSGDKYKL